MSQSSNKILVVDDDPTFRHGLHASLKSSGYEVDSARNAEEALEYVRQHPVGMVLLDINMPGLGGLEVCRRIRAAAPHAGIVMLTVRDAEDDKVAALETGADDYLTKPFCLPELLPRLHAIRRRTNGEGVAPVPVRWRTGTVRGASDVAESWEGRSPFTEGVRDTRAADGTSECSV